MHCERNKITAAAGMYLGAPLGSSEATSLRCGSLVAATLVRFLAAATSRKKASHPGRLQKAAATSESRVYTYMTRGHVFDENTERRGMHADELTPVAREHATTAVSSIPGRSLPLVHVTPRAGAIVRGIRVDCESTQTTVAFGVACCSRNFRIHT